MTIRVIWNAKVPTPKTHPRLKTFEVIMTEKVSSLMPLVFGLPDIMARICSSTCSSEFSIFLEIKATCSSRFSVFSSVLSCFWSIKEMMRLSESAIFSYIRTTCSWRLSTTLARSRGSAASSCRSSCSSSLLRFTWEYIIRCWRPSFFFLCKLIADSW